MNRHLKNRIQRCPLSYYFQGKCQDGYSLKEIAEYLAEYYNTVSRVTKKMDKKRRGKRADIKREDE